VFYLLIFCNTPLSVNAGHTFFCTSLLEYLLKRRDLTIVKPSWERLVLILLDKIDVFCGVDNCALRRYISEQTAHAGIVEKINTILFEPRQLKEICRHRIHQHFSVKVQRYINVVKSRGIPSSIVDFLQYRDLLKSFDDEDIKDFEENSEDTEHFYV